MRIEVRRAGAADAVTLARLRWRWDREEDRPPVTDEAAFVADFARWVADHLASHLPFVAEADGEPVGMAWLVLASRVPTPTLPARPTGDVQSVFVQSSHRNAGVGAALVAALLAEARARKLRHVTVHSGERAVPFYLRNGFRDVGRWFEWRPGADP
jgi:GNAT superfamily N-acetyltransferase